MKWSCVLCLMIFSFPCFSQTPIESLPIQVSFYKTTNIVFPEAIKSVDRGSGEVIAQKAKGIENILQLKAARQHFINTNLSVITADGKLYSFMLSYAGDPAVLNISLAKDSSYLFRDEQQVLGEKYFLYSHQAGEGAELILRSIYIKDQLIWFTLECRNYSFLDYHPEYFHFFIEDKRKAARTAIQETALSPVYPESILQAVPGKKTKKFTLAFAPFSFSTDKKMTLAMSEKNGGRPLTLSISAHTFLKAKRIL
ncbi:MAG TPA: conjugative transposon protein TraN [Puia sp.]|nr:conjugative transposon protein TraN [Puia sp.]